MSLGLAQIVIQASVTSFSGSTKTVAATHTGNTLWLTLYSQSSANLGTTTVTDSASQTWTKLATSTAGTGRYGELWVVTNSASITSVTTTNSTVSSSFGVGYSFYEPSGTLTGASAIDTSNVLATGSSSGPLSCPVTPGSNGDLVWSAVHWNTNLTGAISQSTSGYTTTGLTVENNGNVALGLGLPGGVSTACGWTASASQGSVSFALALKAATGGRFGRAILLG